MAAALLGNFNSSNKGRNTTICMLFSRLQRPFNGPPRIALVANEVLVIEAVTTDATPATCSIVAISAKYCLGISLLKNWKAGKLCP